MNRTYLTPSKEEIIMSRNSSPFAALSSRDQQERWLEFQNTKLPYINGEVDTIISEQDSDWLGRSGDPRGMRAPNNPTPYSGMPQGQANSRPMMGQLDYQPKNFHRQYDTVIRRMMEAEKQARKYQQSPL
jgi:hypothetical protein